MGPADVCGRLAGPGRIEHDGYQGGDGKGRSKGTEQPHGDDRTGSTEDLIPPPSRTPPLHRITVNEYERIIASGALEDPGRVELIDGYMVDKMGKNAEHGYSTIKALKALEGRLPAGWSARRSSRCGSPRTTSRSRTSRSSGAPTPITGTGSPTPADVALLVEVSDSMLGQDRA